MYYTNENIKLYYEIIGEGHPLLILHGFSIDHRGVKGIVEESIDLNKYQRIYIDLPGMGQSPAPTKMINADDLVTSLLEFLNFLIGNQSFSLLGYSYGGYLCLGMMKKLSKQVKSLVLLAPVIKANSADRTLPKKPSKQVHSFEVTNNPIFDQYKHSVVNVTEEGYERYLNEIYCGLNIGDHDFQKSFQGSGYSLGSEKSLLANAIDCDSLIILGTQDMTVGFQDISNYKSMFPKGRFIIIETAGHNLQIDERKQIRTELKRFWTAN